MIEKSILPPGWQVPQEFRTRLGASVGCQRPMRADGHLLLVLHAPPKPEDQIAALDRQEEEARTADAYFGVLEQLTPIHRAVQNLYQVLQEARNMCPDYRDIIDVRDRAYVIERTADLLFSGTKNSLDFIVAKRAEEQVHASHRMAAAAHRLNILAAFFFPIITLTTIFGVDVATMVAIFGSTPK